MAYSALQQYRALSKLGLLEAARQGYLQSASPPNPVTPAGYEPDTFSVVVDKPAGGSNTAAVRVEVEIPLPNHTPGDPLPRVSVSYPAVADSENYGAVVFSFGYGSTGTKWVGYAPSGNPILSIYARGVKKSPGSRYGWVYDNTCMPYKAYIMIQRFGPTTQLETIDTEGNTFDAIIPPIYPEEQE